MIPTNKFNLADFRKTDLNVSKLFWANKAEISGAITTLIIDITNTII
tara:strand:+ start:407 stop:547 length:141 start_codon:yes stop_codon:yes gene_type:complete